MLVYIGSSSCGFSNVPEMPDLVERAKLSVQQQALDKGLAFSTVGVSIDWATNRGINHLEKFGMFDEVITGRSWQGMGGVRLVL